MLQIQLNPDEAELLHRILFTYLSDLRVEIADTDIEGFQEILKKEEEFIDNTLRRLEGEATTRPETRFGEYV
ncbi:MAG: hypothetical protein KGJ80_03210 [Chloroflexota bacterium]|nr:hypothetical protein [Chloroflexota bacterium]